MMPYQKGLILSTKPGEYDIITHVDSEHGVVTLQDVNTGKTKPFLPRNKDHKYTSLFVQSEKPLSTGDKIMPRFTDKARGIKANVEYTISRATKEEITALSKEGQTLSLNPNQLKDGHWDYAYTRTADMAQGATYQNVITTLKGKGALTNLRRAYIDLSRASSHVKLFTDNPKQMMKSWLSKEVNKHSAIETIENIAPHSTPYFNDKALPHEDVRYQNRNGDFNYNQFKDHINQALPKYAESLAINLLGQPNPSKSDRDYLTFGIGKSAIKVSLTGEYRGYFKDYTTGEKGSLINLMMIHKKITYKEAMQEAHNMLNEPDKYQLTANPKRDQLLTTTPKHMAQFEEREKEYIQTSQPLTGTLAETYLNKWGIEHPKNDHVHFHQEVYSSEDKTFHPAMITNIHDKKGETKAIEVTYLDGQGNKDPALDINPRILGTKSKQMTQFHQGSDLHTTIISTSIENAFIINQAHQGQYDIINVNHKNDIQNISTDELRQNIVIVLSQENTDLNPNNIEKIMANFSGRHIQFVSPDNMLEEIKQAIEQYHQQTHQQKEEFDTPTQDHDSLTNKTDTDINQHTKAIKDKELEHFDSKEASPQKTFDFNQERDNNHDQYSKPDKELER